MNGPVHEAASNLLDYATMAPQRCHYALIRGVRDTCLDFIAARQPAIWQLRSCVAHSPERYRFPSPTAVGLSPVAQAHHATQTARPSTPALYAAAKPVPQLPSRDPSTQSHYLRCLQASFRDLVIRMRKKKIENGTTKAQKHTIGR